MDFTRKLMVFFWQGFKDGSAAGAAPGFVKSGSAEKREIMKVTLKDGSFKEYDQPMSIYDIALDISEGLARVACVGEIDGEVKDLRTIVDKDCTLNILTFDSDAGKKAYRHTCAHVLAQAVKNLYPDAKLTIGPAIDNGYYYDFDMPSLDRDGLDAIEKEMKKIIKKGDRLERYTLSKDEAIKLMTE